MSGLDWSRCNQSSFDTETGYRVNYTYCTNGNIEDEFIDRAIQNSSNSFFRYLSSKGMRYSNCKNENLLEIYEVELDVLNDSNRFNKWQANNPGINSIWALFDTRDYQPGLSAVIITNQGLPTNHYVFAHEMAHYWADRLCLPLTIGVDDEQFTTNFERYYIREYETGGVR